MLRNTVIMYWQVNVTCTIQLFIQYLVIIVQWAHTRIINYPCTKQV